MLFLHNLYVFQNLKINLALSFKYNLWSKVDSCFFVWLVRGVAAAAARSVLFCCLSFVTQSRLG